MTGEGGTVLNGKRDLGSMLGRNSLLCVMQGTERDYTENCECPVPGSVQGHVRQDFEQPDLVGDLPCPCREFCIR